MKLPQIQIFLNDSLEVVIAHVREADAEPLTIALNSVELFGNGQADAETRMGAIVLAILENWHGAQFRDIGKKLPQADFVVDDHYIIQELISKSMQQKTKGHVNTIGLLLKGKEIDDQYATLLSIWPDLKQMFEKYPN